MPVAISFTEVFILCETGERLTAQFNKDDTGILQWNWYTFPLDIQKILPIILSDTQNPFIMRGFGGVACTRESFKSVSHLQLLCTITYDIDQWRMFVKWSFFQVLSGGFSYFTLLRQIWALLFKTFINQFKLCGSLLSNNQYDNCAMSNFVQLFYFFNFWSTNQMLVAWLNINFLYIINLYTQMYCMLWRNVFFVWIKNKESKSLSITPSCTKFRTLENITQM